MTMLPTLRWTAGVLLLVSVSLGGADAFVSTSTSSASRQRQQQQQRQPSRLHMIKDPPRRDLDIFSRLDADRKAFMLEATMAPEDVEQNDHYSLLSDGSGKINRVLAERLWQWEQSQHSNGDDHKFPYSVRKGLRLVQEIITKYYSNRDADDFVQEGIVALMQAMNSYHDHEPVKNKEEGEKRFERYARAYIMRQLQLTAEATAFFKDDQRKTSSFISIEDTVSVQDPESPKYRNLNQWERSHDVVLGGGTRLDAEEFLDENLELEGDDLMWVKQNQVAEPLKDSIQDNEIMSEGDEMTDLIRNDVDEFLRAASLDDTQTQVVRLRFGFGDAPRSPRQVALILGLELSQVLVLQEQALGKLRQAYADRYIQIFGDSYDDDIYQEDYVWEDSV